MTEAQYDIAAPLLSLALLVGYRVYLRWKIRQQPRYTNRSVATGARVAWVLEIMNTPGKEILAVQTLRNSTMAATFMASTAILLIFGVLNLLQHASDLGAWLQALPHPAQESHAMAKIKLLALLGVLFFAFFSFALAVRHYHHLGFLINAGGVQKGGPEPAYVAAFLNRSGLYFSIGMRAYYLIVPLVFWLFGPTYLLLTSAGLVLALYHIDRAPEVAVENIPHGDGKQSSLALVRVRRKGRDTDVA